MDKDKVESCQNDPSTSGEKLKEPEMILWIMIYSTASFRSCYMDLFCDLSGKVNCAVY